MIIIFNFRTTGNCIQNKAPKYKKSRPSSGLRAALYVNRQVKDNLIPQAAN